MPKILLTPETLKERATQVNQCMEEQKQVISDIAKLIDSLGAGWEGEAYNGFIEAFNSAKPTYEKFAVDLTNFSKFLEEYSNSMELLDLGGGRQIRDNTAGAQ